MRYGKDDPEIEEADRRLECELENIIETNAQRYRELLKKASETGVRDFMENKDAIYEEIFDTLNNIDEACEKMDLYAIKYRDKDWNKKWQKVKRLKDYYSRLVNKGERDEEER